MKKLFYLPLLFAFLFVACDNNENNEQTTTTPPTATEYKQSQANNLADIVQSKTFKASDGLSFTSNKGVKVIINANSLYSNGVPVTGDVVFEFAELYKRGDMLAVNRPLMGTDAAGNKGPMITGGQFYINVKQDGKDITGNYNLQVPAVNTDALNLAMGFWIGNVDEQDNVLWEEVARQDEKMGGVFPNGETNQYNVFGTHFGWINVDILMSLPGEKTPILVSVPDGFDNKNSSVYVAYKGKPGSLAYLDVYDADQKLFTEHYGLGPIGFNFYVVFTSIKDGKFIYAIKEVTLQKNTVIKIESSELKTKTKEDLIALINGLE